MSLPELLAPKSVVTSRSSDALRAVVGLSSEARGWAGLTAWHQTIPLKDEKALGPLDAHHLMIQCDGMSHVQQRRDGRLHKSFWRRDEFSLLPAGSTGTWQIDGRADVLHIDLECALIARVASEVFGRDASTLQLRSLLHAHDAELGQLARMLLRELGTTPAGGNLYAESLATVLAVQLITKYSDRPCEAGANLAAGGGLPPDMYRHCVEYIDSNLEGDLCLQNLAGQTGYSAWHFSRLFKQGTGLSPYRYVMERRIERAKTLLLDDSRSVAEVALCVGFVDQSHLARIFRLNVGMTPIAFRKMRSAAGRGLEDISR
jgi:AraC family transcriptional regulator